MENPYGRLSPSEWQTLKQLAGGEQYASEFDWVALQRLKRMGLAEGRSTGVALTKEGRRVLRRLASEA